MCLLYYEDLQRAGACESRSQGLPDGIVRSSRKRVLPALAALVRHVQGSTRGTPAARILLAQQPLSFSPRKNTEERVTGQIPAPFSRIDISIAYIYEIHTRGQIPLYIPFLERD